MKTAGDYARRIGVPALFGLAFPGGISNRMGPCPQAAFPDSLCVRGEPPKRLHPHLPMNKNLSDHISATYRALRIGIAVTAFAFPILLAVGGYLLAGLALEGSMSAYYHAGNSVMRNVFVGILFAVGMILFLYQGFTRLEDWALNLAGVFALGVALFPTAWPAGSGGSPFSTHGISAVLFFLCIAYVCIFRASDTLSLVKDPKKRERYRALYKIIGIAMIASPVIAFVLISLLKLNKSIIFFVEAAGVYVFSWYWLLKSREIAQTNADRKAARGKLHVKPHGLSDAFRRLPVDETS